MPSWPLLRSSALPRSCNLLSHTCVHTLADNACGSDDDCDGTSFCNSTTGTCSTTIAFGSPCNAQLPSPGCARGSTCTSQTSYYGPLGPNICTPFHSVPSGEEFFDYYAPMTLLATSDAFRLCASGFGVPVPDPVNGFYPTSAIRCVASVDFSRVLQPCPSCEWSNGLGSTLPLSSDGMLACAPVNQTGGSCAYLPSNVINLISATSQVVYSACMDASKAPNGAPCGYSNSAASCSSSSCWGVLVAGAAATASGPFNALWQQYFPSFLPAPLPACSSVANLALANYAASLGSASCPLPSAFTSAGWSCGGFPAAKNPSKSGPNAGVIAGATIGAIAGTYVRVAFQRRARAAMQFE